MSGHAPLSPSESHRWIHCPGSYTLVESLPKEAKDNTQAEIGTAVHELANRVFNNPDMRPDYIAYKYDGADKVLRVDDDMLWSARYMAKRAKLALYRYFPSMPAWGFEKRVHVTPHIWGTADFFTWWPDERELRVVDFKNGRVPVSLNGHDEYPNTQLMCYALGLLELVKGPVSDIRVELEIVQPRSRNGKYLQESSFRTNILYKWRDEVLLPAEQKALDPDSPRIPGNWCEWCPAKGACPEIGLKSQEIAQAVFADFVNPIPQPSLIRLPDVLRWAPVMRAWLDDCFVLAQRLLEEGEKVKGFKLSKGRMGNRQWPGWIQSPEDLATALCLDVEDVLEKKIKSPAAIGRMGVKPSIAVRAEGKLSVVADDSGEEEDSDG